MANETWETIKSDVLRDAKQCIDDDVEYYADEDFDEDNLYDDLFTTDRCAEMAASAISLCSVMNS